MSAKKRPAVAVPLSAAASSRKDAAAAERLLSRAIDMFAAEVPIPPSAITSAGIPISGGKTMMDAQKFRVNWYGLERKQLGRIARLVAARNWFAAPVHRLNKSLYGGGFQLKDPAARKWAALGTYPFKRIHDDILHEYLISGSALAFWRTDAGASELPMIEVPDMENVDYDVVAGAPRVWITIPSNKKLDPKLEIVLGKKMFEAIKTGKPLILTKGDDTSGYDFEILKDGKSTGLIEPPSITGILDDLDFIEAARVGDWNGAWARREIIRHTKKGFGVSSGPNAGSTRGNAKYGELQSILKAMKNILGKADVATNFDQEISWLTFPANEFFSAGMIEAALQRLVFWGGLAAILLLKTDSQITGLSAFLYDRLRGQVDGFRDDFGPFLGRVFNSESFKKNFPAAPDLSVAWSVKSLYTGAALNSYATFASTYGILSPPSIRELYGIDDEEESLRMRSAHAEREDYTPPYEPRQGLLPSLFPADYQQDTSAPPVKPLDDKPVPGAPVKPKPGDPVKPKPGDPVKPVPVKPVPAKSKLPGKPGRPAKV
jgi:hypothetical protein